ncbi:MAG: hypothetical protein WBQ21_08420 [Solirubrobacteraceae bacterium]
MSGKAERGVPVTFADGVRDDVASLVTGTDDEASELLALKRRVAELLVECKANPYLGDMMGPGRHPELAGCRRVRFDIPTHRGKPRFRLIYRNEPSDGASAECRWLPVAPRAGLRAHRQTSQRSRRTP